MKPGRTDDLTEREKDILTPYLTDTEATVFSLKNLNPEVIGAALARYSRAPTGFKETIVREFLDDHGKANEVKGSEMIDRVVNKYGDESVAELAVAPLCIEEVSNLMTKIIEDCRIGGSPIEESTRYVLYDVPKNGQWRYVRPANIIKSGLGEKYVKTMDFIFDAYASLVDPMKELFQKRLPQEDFKIEVERAEGTLTLKQSELIDDNERRAHRIAYGFAIRSAACDVIRCILPASTKANLGLVGNGRFYSNLISKLLSQDLHEAKSLAENIQKALNHQIPTFIKRAARNDYYVTNNNKMQTLADALFKGIKIGPNPEAVLLEDKPEDLQVNMLASILFPYVKVSTEQIRQVVKSLPEEKQDEIFNTYIGDRKTKRDRPGRGLEYGYPIQFDLIAGFAEYRDLQRHRMLTQQRQDIGISLGYSIPGEIKEIGKSELVKECYDHSENLYRDFISAGMVKEAQYAPLFNHLIRWNMGMNLRELGHLVELRSQRSGHPKYRRLVQNMAKLYLKRDPKMEPVLSFVDHNDYDDGIARAEQEARTARKSLATGVFDDID